MNKYTLPSKLASVEKIDGGFEGNMPVTGSKRNDALMEAMGELYKAQELIAGLQAEILGLKNQIQNQQMCIFEHNSALVGAPVNKIKEQGE